MQNKLATLNTVIAKLRIFHSPLYCLSFYLAFLVLAQFRFVLSYIHPLQLLFFGWAMLVLLTNLLFQREIFQVVGKWWILAILASGVASTVANFDSYPDFQIKSWLLLCVALLVAYPAGKYIATRPNPAKSFALTLLPSQLIVMGGSLLSFASIITHFQYDVVIDGKRTLLGIPTLFYTKPPTTILFGAWLDSNHAAIFCITSIAYCLWILRNRSTIFRTSNLKLITNLLVIICIIQTICLILHNSRGATITLWFISLTCLPLLVTLLVRKRYGRGFGKKAAGVSLVAVLCGVTFANGIETTIEDSYSNYYYATASYFQDLNKTTYEPKDDVSFSKGVATSSARVYIWKETLELWQHYPLFGVGSYNTQDRAIKAGVTGVKQYLQRGTVPHNSYLDVLVFYGIFGFLAYLGFFTNYLVRLRRKFKQNLTLNDIILTLMISGIMMGVMFLSDSYIGFDFLFGTLLIALGTLIHLPTAPLSISESVPDTDKASLALE